MSEIAPAAQFPSVIDNTMRSDFVVCAHRWLRRHCQGLRPKGQTNIHLHFGGCFASGLKVTRRLYATGTSVHQSIIRGAEDIIRQWGDYEMPDLPPPAAYKTLEACLDAHYSYFLEYPLETDRVRIFDEGHGPFVEVSFAIPIPGAIHPGTGEPIIYSGKFDMVGRIGETVWVVDEKTTSRLGDSWIDQWKMDSQLTGYCWGLSQWGIRARHALVRGVSILARDIGFAESIQTRPEWQIEQWLTQLRDDVKRMLIFWEAYQRELETEIAYINTYPIEASSFPMALSRSACHQYNKPCAFVPLCSSPDPDSWLSEYEVDFWDPLKSEENV